ncbi:phage tail assembly protein T [Taylorella equigenitalis]|uniref:phage tail assembly protein T n=1 Tax=Taylorella equigenitalis TaxID=29575 RepID=UPI00237E81D0|nr:DUF4035 domain-containing protein [Taylorella equigenitalis]WDU51567.1 DUF4035 domain-containing protein [Taylorella equigenitalis]WEE00121.1 DUF4035 domain-containing protein [Taylorella equigenitalis]WEE01598.1 DUF4035 domain-containing protein [Taylorella equigenitalis]WFD78135.1 DUF4035 domain-containing protein [Taylorella equigenitalis]WFD79613.1 DUF4035 domain-containing protein [Taylorella equigenitalis]
MPESELDIWYQFYSEQPFGLWRSDYNHAIIASTMANTVSTKAMKPLDFMTFFDKKEDVDFFDDGLVIV